jgi:hypothetical protein
VTSTVRAARSTDHLVAAFVKRLNEKFHMANDSVSIVVPSLVDAAVPLHSELHVELTRRGFWLRWLPTFIGFIAGGALATAVAGRLDSVTAAVIGGALAGAVIGGGQWLVLRRVLPGAAWWIAATAVGQAVGLAVGAPLVGYGTEPRDLAVQGAVTGLAIGVLQSLVLRRGAANGLWWALAMPPLWTLGWLVTWAGRIDVDQQFFNFGAYGAIAFTVLSGFLLIRLLRVPHSGGAVLRPAGEYVR